MSIKSRATTEDYRVNFDKTFKKSNKETPTKEVWLVCATAGDTYKVSARFYSSGEALDYARNYPRDASCGILCPGDCWDISYKEING